jgi:hypothetical protein
MDADVHVSNLCFAVGNRIPASQVQEQQLVAYKKMELQKISDILDQHLLLCAQQKVLFASQSHLPECKAKLICNMQYAET